MPAGRKAGGRYHAHMKRSLLLAALMALAALAPLSASASITLFNGSPSDYVGQYYTQLSNDMAPYQSQVYVQASYNTWPLPAASNFVVAGDNNTFFYDTAASAGTRQANLSVSTVNRLCAIIDPTATGAVQAADTNWTGTNGKGKLYAYTPTAVGYLPAGWNAQDPNNNDGCSSNGDACHYGLHLFTCTTSAPPGQTLSIDKTSITLGQSAKLSWADIAPRDTTWAPDNSHLPYSYGFYLPPAPPDTCTTSGFTIPPTTQTRTVCNHWSTVSSCGGPLNLAQPQQGALAAVAFSSSGASSTATGRELAAIGGQCTYSFQCVYGAAGGGGNASQSVPVPDYGPGTTTVTPTAAGTYTYSYNCTNANGTTNKSVTLTVNAAAAADLTVTSGATPTTTTAGTAVKFSATVKNIGNASTGSSFPVLYQKATDGNGTSASNIGTQASAPALAAGASETSTMDTGVSLTAGTWYVRACANTTNNVTFSSVEPSTATGNNCGAWTAVTVNPAPAAPTVTATVNGASSASITTAQTFDLKMTSTNAASCTWSRTGSYSGNWTNQPVPAPNTSYDSGALTWPAGNATWTFTCTNSTGSKSGAASVTITNPTCANGAANPPSCTQCPNNLAYQSGSCVACSNGGCTGVPGGTPGNPTGGLTCNNGATNPPSCTTQPPSCSQLSVSSQDVNVGDTVTLTWKCKNASSCKQTSNSNGFATGNKINSSDTTNPLTTAGSYPFGMYCDNTFFRFPTVTVHNPTCALSASPDRVASGSTVSFTVNATDVKSCTITAPGYSKTVPVTNGTCSSAPITSPAITAQTTFSLTCKPIAAGTIAPSNVTVNILPAFQEF